MVAYILCWKFPTSVLQKTRLVECGVFITEDTRYATITVHSIIIIKWIATSSSVTSKIVLDSIILVIL